MTFRTKLIIAFTLSVGAALFPVPKNSAQPSLQNSPMLPPPAALSCNVQGAIYPVDGSGRMWAITNGGKWTVVAEVSNGPGGTEAVRNDGTRAPSVCH